ncbi:MAG: energy-coupling factor ABC transporter ATP-binding protein [Planctomycetota bacterium]
MSEPLLSLRDVAFAYGPQRPVLDGVTFDLADGERLGLTGGNGSGKTTLLHLIVGLLRPTAGEIWAFGQTRRREADFLEVRRRAGLLFQDPEDQLFCPTVAEDVAFGPLNLGKSAAEAEAIATETLERIGLPGYQDRITYKLSGGEKRLVSLAAVLAMEPDVLLFDEPTNGLDEEHVSRLLAILNDLPHAALVVSHHRDFLDATTTRQVRLADGRLQPRQP